MSLGAPAMFASTAVARPIPYESPLLKIATSAGSRRRAG